MRRTSCSMAVVFLCVLGSAVACMAADPDVKTGEDRDTLLYVRTTPPGAKVLLDGKELGTSDGVFPVEPGVGTIQVELDGHKPSSKKITIRADGVTRVELKLVRGSSDEDSKDSDATLPDVGEPREGLRFRPLVERVVNKDNHTVGKSLIDLDTGVLFDSPELGTDKERMAWAVKNGVDAFCETVEEVQGLVGLNMIVVPLNKERWNSITPDAILSQLEVGMPGTPAVMSGRGDLPATFLFQTREGGKGVLQIVGFQEESKGVKIRYKLLDATTKTKGENGDAQSQNFIVEGVGWKDVRVGMSREDLIKVMGKPSSDPSSDWLKWPDKHIDCIFHTGSLVVSEVRFNRGFMGALANGVKVGASGSKMLKLYGEPEHTSDQGRGGKTYEYSSKGILFWTYQGKISQIVVFKPAIPTEDARPATPTDRKAAANNFLATQLGEAKAGSYMAKYNLWDAYHRGTNGVEKNPEEARKWLTEFVKGHSLVKFRPVKPFAPQTPQEFLAKFSAHSTLRSGPGNYGGACFFRTKVEDGVLIGSFLTIVPDKMREDIAAMPFLELVSSEELTPEVFVAYEASPQESLSNAEPRSAQTGDRAGQQIKARKRMQEDRQTFSDQELQEIESLYQVANKKWQTQEARDSLNKLVEKYKKANRTGCAILYLGQMNSGDQKIAYFKQAIADHSDCFYGDGVQVGAFARFLLGQAYLSSGKAEEAATLFEEIRKYYPDSVDHGGKSLVAQLSQEESHGNAPHVVSMNPPNGAKDVDPGLRELRVTFDEPMAGGFAWCGGGPSYPTTPKDKMPSWTEDRKTCILSVELKPNWEYRLFLNAPSFEGFQSADGVPLAPVEYTFTTQAVASWREFDLVVRAGRGQLTQEELQQLQKEGDPLVSQLADPNTKKLVELFANLPDHSHQELRKSGYLKWKFTAIDPPSQKVCRDAIQLNLDMAKKQGAELPPTISLEALQKADVGIAIVQIDELQAKAVSWFVLLPEHPAPIWVTVVGTKAAGKPPYFAAHMQQLLDLRGKLDSQPLSEISSLAMANDDVLNESERLYRDWTEKFFQGMLNPLRFQNISTQERAAEEERCLERLSADDGDVVMRISDINALAALKSKKAVPGLLKIAAERVEKDNRERWIAVRALGIIGDQSVVPELVHLTYHYNMNTRFWARISLVRLTGQDFGRDVAAWKLWWEKQGGTPPIAEGTVVWATSPEAREWADPEKMDEMDRQFVAQQKMPATAGQSAGVAPQIVSLSPSNGAKDVDPALRELRVTFNVPMSGGMSWCGSGPHFPTAPQGKKASWTEDRKTCILPVELKPNWEYRLGLNAPSFNNFQSASGVPLEPVEYTFTTAP